MQFPTFLRMFHLYFHHFNNESNIITIVAILEMRMRMTWYLFLYQRSTATAFDIFKNVPPLFSSFQQSIKYYYHCSDIRNAYVNDMLPIFISAINGNGV